MEIYDLNGNLWSQWKSMISMEISITMLQSQLQHLDIYGYDVISM